MCQQCLRQIPAAADLCSVCSGHDGAQQASQRSLTDGCLTGAYLASENRSSSALQEPFALGHLEDVQHASSCAGVYIELHQIGVGSALGQGTLACRLPTLNLYLICPVWMQHFACDAGLEAGL